MANNGATTIMIIRHAEKPGGYYGTTYNGVDAVADTCGASAIEDLTTVGWERSGALVTLFAPPWGPKPGLSTPKFLYAADPLESAETKPESGPSHRPYQTLLALAAKLGSVAKPQSINTAYRSPDYKQMVDDALGCAGTVLICWQHEDIALQNAAGKAGMSQHILTKTGTQGTLNVPTTWPLDSNKQARYDLVFVFNRSSGTGAIESFQIIAQNLLAGDCAAPSLSHLAGA